MPTLFPLSLSKVIEWIKSEGETSLAKYSALSLECGDTIRDEEQEFEKYYFISMVSHPKFKSTSSLKLP
jgi:hypothetical protein